MSEESRPPARGSLIASLSFLVVFLSLAWTTVPRLLSLVREASALSRLSRTARRARVNGPIVADVKAIKRAIPAGRPVALIGSVDDVIFANYYGYPWSSRDYRTLDVYRAMAGEPRRPSTIVVVNGGARLTTYGALREERLRDTRLVRNGVLKRVPSRFVIPLAASVDGLPPDSYVTEAELKNDGDRPAQVHITLLPEQTIRTVTIPSHRSLDFYDLVYQLFGILEARWAVVESDQPLLAGAWFVNRGRKEMAQLALIDEGDPAAWKSGVLTCPAAECKVWLLNRFDHGIGVTVDGTVVALAPRGMTSLPFRGTVHVLSHADSFAFATTKSPPTRFVWPEGVHP